MIVGVKNKHFCEKCGADLNEKGATTCTMFLDFVDGFEQHYKCNNCGNQIIVSDKSKEEDEK